MSAHDDFKKLQDKYDTVIRCKHEEQADICPWCEIDLLRITLETLVEFTDVPDANCSCHIAPPYGDCVAYAGIREALDQARTVLAKATS